jgi:hypothetical protein
VAFKRTRSGKKEKKNENPKKEASREADQRIREREISQGKALKIKYVFYNANTFLISDGKW